MKLKLRRMDRAQLVPLLTVGLLALLLGVLAGLTLHDVLEMAAEQAAGVLVALLMLGGGRQ